MFSKMQLFGLTWTCISVYCITSIISEALCSSTASSRSSFITTALTLFPDIPETDRQFSLATNSGCHQTLLLLENMTSLVFAVRTCADAILQLTEHNDDVYVGDAYEIRIASLSPSDIQLIKTRNGHNTSDVTTNATNGYLLSCTAQSSFWLSWTETGSVRLGRGVDPTTNESLQLLYYQDLLPFAIRYALICASATHPSNWTVPGSQYMSGHKLLVPGGELSDMVDTGVESVSARKWFVFQVRAPADAIVELTFNGSLAPLNMYEIVIGGAKNYQCYIRKNHNGGELLRRVTEDILSASDYRWFWLSWQEGRVTMGRGFQIGLSDVMSYTDPRPVDVNFVSLMSYEKTVGYWIVPRYFYVPVTSGSIYYTSDTTTTIPATASNTQGESTSPFGTRITTVDATAVTNTGDVVRIAVPATVCGFVLLTAITAAILATVLVCTRRKKAARAARSAVIMVDEDSGTSYGVFGRRLSTSHSDWQSALATAGVSSTSNGIFGISHHSDDSFSRNVDGGFISPQRLEISLEFPGVVMRPRYGPHRVGYRCRTAVDTSGVMVRGPATRPSARDCFRHSVSDRHDDVRLADCTFRRFSGSQMLSDGCDANANVDSVPKTFVGAACLGDANESRLLSTGCQSDEVTGARMLSTEPTGEWTSKLIASCSTSAGASYSGDLEWQYRSEGNANGDFQYMPPATRQLSQINDDTSGYENVEPSCANRDGSNANTKTQSLLVKNPIYERWNVRRDVAAIPDDNVTACHDSRDTELTTTHQLELATCSCHNAKYCDNHATAPDNDELNVSTSNSNADKTVMPDVWMHGSLHINSLYVPFGAVRSGCHEASITSGRIRVNSADYQNLTMARQLTRLIDNPLYASSVGRAPVEVAELADTEDGNESVGTEGAFTGDVTVCRSPSE